MKDRLPCVHYIATSLHDSCQVNHCALCVCLTFNIPDSKFHGANMGPIWGRQDPGGPLVGHRNLAIWDILWCATQHILIYMQDAENLMTTDIVKYHWKRTNYLSIIPPLSKASPVQGGFILGLKHKTWYLMNEWSITDNLLICNMNQLLFTFVYVKPQIFVYPGNKVPMVTRVCPEWYANSLILLILFCSWCPYIFQWWTTVHCENVGFHQTFILMLKSSKIHCCMWF